MNKSIDEIFELFATESQAMGFTVNQVSWDKEVFRNEKEYLSMVYFRVKQLKGWMIGFWFTGEGDKFTMELFAQHEDNVDKFKPSRSVYMTSRTINQDITLVSWTALVRTSIREVLYPLKYDKYLAYYRDYWGDYPKSKLKSRLLYYTNHPKQQWELLKDRWKEKRK